MKKNILTKKTGNVTFYLAKIDLSIFLNNMNFSDAFLIFENFVYRKMFKSYLRIIWIDYPETSWVYCVVFSRKHVQISWLNRFFKTKNKILKIRKKIWKNPYDFGQIEKSILAKKS